MRKNPLILLVDDEEIFLEMASLALRRAGYLTISAHGVPEAIQKAEELLPDLMLSDISMPPGPNGLQLAVALRQNPKTKNMKIAFLTSMAEPWLELPETERAEAKIALGDVVFLDKDDDIESLDARVAKIMPRATGDAEKENG